VTAGAAASAKARSVELTVRVLILGALITLVLTAANVYIVSRSG